MILGIANGHSDVFAILTTSGTTLLHVDDPAPVDTPDDPPGPDLSKTSTCPQQT